MRYKVTYRKRFTPEGEEADSPHMLVDPPDGVILDSEIVEVIPPAGLGVAEDLNEGSGSQESNDNGFLGLGSETWEYDIAEGREQEFKNAVVNSKVALAIEEVPDESLTT
jgi:hypothetical protein